MIAHICFGVLESGDVAMDEALSTNSTKHKTQNEIFCPSVVVLCRENFFWNPSRAASERADFCMYYLPYF